MYKKCKVVILPTEKKSGTIKIENLLFTDKGLNFEKQIYQHFYIISLEEEIKEGDWYIRMDNSYQGRINPKLLQKSFEKAKDSDIYFERKVIASTDLSLNLPQPSQSFIEEYITNKGNLITDVMVEYEESCCDIKVNGGLYSPDCCHKHILCLKINSDNIITIKRVKDSWSREEVSKAIHDCMLLANDVNGIGRLQKFINKWIKENL